MRLDVDHRTIYRYDPAMRRVAQSLRVWPSLFAGQKVLEWNVVIEADGARRGASFRDGAGDLIETLTILRPVSEIVLHIAGSVETADLSGVLKGHKEKVPPEAYLRATPMTRLDSALFDLSAEALNGETDPLAQAHNLSRAVSDAIVYQPGTTASTTTAAESLALGHGVCQDQTHALIALARAAEMPGRYVTGYLHSSADGSAHEASHAWAEIWVANLGWVGFDAANRCCPDEKYIRLGSGLDATDAAPVRGIASGGGTEALEVNVSITQGAEQQ